MKPELVIFDCDGVLVDTETIANEVLSEFLKDIGLDLSPLDCHHRFNGTVMDDIKEEAERMSGKKLPDDWVEQVQEADLIAFEAGIESVPGVLNVVAHLKAEGIPFCVGSSGRYEKMQMTLGTSGLWDTFKDVLYSSQDCEKGKPAPDVFLYAAKGMGYQPEQCVVIEDSIAGIKAAKAAGMRVFNYAGDSNADIAQAQALGATTFNHMSELPALLGLVALDQASA